MLVFWNEIAKSECGCDAMLVSNCISLNILKVNLIQMTEVSLYLNRSSIKMSWNVQSITFVHMLNHKIYSRSIRFDDGSVGKFARIGYNMKILLEFIHSKDH